MYNKRFKNLHKRIINRSVFNYLFWFLGFYNNYSRNSPIPENFAYPNPREKREGSYKVTWINHSTFLIEADGIRFITDPIFGQRCSPFSFLGPKRRHPPIPPLEKLPSLDFVLLSHNHYDHMEKATLQQLQRDHPEIQWIVPKGVKLWFARHIQGIDLEKIRELEWNERQEFRNQSVLCTAVPAQHFSGRGLFDKNRSLWMGFVIEVKEKRFYFAGDTGYNEIDFKEMGRLYKKFDLSILPIGAYWPPRFMSAVHINPEEAVKIHQEVGSALSIGGHWKTFKLSDEEIERPPYDLYCALHKVGLSTESFRVLDPGQTIVW